MRKYLLSGALVVFGILLQPAFAGTKDALIANTVSTTMPDGATTFWHFNKDGTYTTTGPDGTAGHGTWSFGNGRICVSSPGDQKVCSVLGDDHGVGDAWRATNSEGKSYKIAIIPRH